MQKRALIIEDDELVRKTLIEMLSLCGFSVITANTGREGINLFKFAIKNNENIEFVLLDLVLPDMNGTSIMEELRAINPSVKVVISTGLADDIAIKNWEKFGFKGILLKPYALKDLKEVLERIS